MSVASKTGPRVALPPPRTAGGKPLLDCLRLRESLRDYDSRPLPPELLSTLLWASFGVSRPDGKRTAPTSFDSREYDLYLFTATAVTRYDAAAHALIHVCDGDLRASTGFADWIPTAPLSIVFVADFAKLKDCPREMLDFCATADVGFICENLSLFCASEGLASCVIGGFDGAKLHQLLSLVSTQKVMMVQTVGYPQ